MRKVNWHVAIFLLILALLLTDATCLLSLAYRQATQPQRIFTGKMGENVFYSFDKATGVVTISGNGEMPSYAGVFFAETDEENTEDEFRYTPMCSIQDCLVKAVITEGVTNISRNAFLDCSNLREVYIPASVKQIGLHAFDYTAVETLYFSGDAPEIPPNCNWIYNLLCQAKLDLRSQTTFVIVHRPGTTGWDSPEWAQFNVVEQDFEVNFDPID